MKEKIVFSLYLVLIGASFIPFFDLFPDDPLLTIGWILGDLLGFVFLTTFIYLNGYFEDGLELLEEDE